jgi:ppGpp synthetase/RelA/SpoT-type nucleotidyltranferase
MTGSDGRNDDQLYLAVAGLLADSQVPLDEAKVFLLAYLQQLCGRLHEQDDDFQYRWFEGRVKIARSVVRALKKAGAAAEQLWLIDDLIGVRAVVLTKSDAATLADAIQADTGVPNQGTAAKRAS